MVPDRADGIPVTGRWQGAGAPHFGQGAGRNQMFEAKCETKAKMGGETPQELPGRKGEIMRNPSKGFKNQGENTEVENIFL